MNLLAVDGIPKLLTTQHRMRTGETVGFCSNAPAGPSWSSVSESATSTTGVRCRCSFRGFGATAEDRPANRPLNLPAAFGACRLPVGRCLMDQVLTESRYSFIPINIRKTPTFSPPFTPHPTALAAPEPSEPFSASI